MKIRRQEVQALAAPLTPSLPQERLRDVFDYSRQFLQHRDSFELPVRIKMSCNLVHDTITKGLQNEWTTSGE